MVSLLESVGAVRVDEPCRCVDLLLLGYVEPEGGQARGAARLFGERARAVVGEAAREDAVAERGQAHREQTAKARVAALSYTEREPGRKGKKGGARARARGRTRGRARGRVEGAGGKAEEGEREQGEEGQRTRKGIGGARSKGQGGNRKRA